MRRDVGRDEVGMERCEESGREKRDELGREMCAGTGGIGMSSNFLISILISDLLSFSSSSSSLMLEPSFELASSAEVGLESCISRSQGCEGLE